MLSILLSAVIAIGVGIIVSVLTYFINKWLDSFFGK